jgi:hypothetical protein
VREPVPPRAEAAAFFALAIRSKRDLLQTLFYATKNNAAEAWELHRRLEAIQTTYPDGSYSIGPGNVMPRQQLVDAKSAAEATAQDSACAFMLIVDATIQRLRTGLDGMDTRDLGPTIEDGVKLNAAIWALANQSRHIHTWAHCDATELEQKQEAQIFRRLRHDPMNLNAAREVLCGLRVNSYVNLEALLLATADDAIAGTGRSIEFVSAGTFLINVDRPAPEQV